jgi:hypothetical protein
MTAGQSDTILIGRMTSASGETACEHRVGDPSNAAEDVEPRRGGALPAASTNHAANGAPRAGGRFVRATAMKPLGAMPERRGPLLS